jgi:hypothetical protein
MRLMKPDLLTIKDIAVVLGVTEKSARLYHEVSQRHRREDRVRDKDMPEPDYRIGRSPVWHSATIEAWRERRGKTPAKPIAA